MGWDNENGLVIEAEIPNLAAVIDNVCPADIDGDRVADQSKSSPVFNTFIRPLLKNSSDTLAICGKEGIYGDLGIDPELTRINIFLIVFVFRDTREITGG